MRLNKSDHGISERFTHVHEREDGSHHVFFAPPPASRPLGWPASYTLPRLGKKRGTLADPKFRDAVVNDAKLLNQQLDAQNERAKHLEGIKAYDMPALVEVYHKSKRYKALSAASKKKNNYHIRHILDWSDSAGHPDVREITGENVEDFLTLFDDRESYQLQIRSTMNILFGEAKKARWIASNPIADIAWTAPEANEQHLWHQEDVDLYAYVATRLGHLGLAALLLAEWEIGQRPADMWQSRHGFNYVDGHFWVKQHKVQRTTKKGVDTPVTARVVDAIERARIDGCEHVFPDTVFGTGFNECRLRSRFVQVRSAVAMVRKGGRHLLLQTLRHSCVYRMAMLGEKIEDIAQITGHKITTVNEIMERYLPRTHARADAITKRVHLASGGKESDFRARPSDDAWLGDHHRAPMIPPPVAPNPDDAETTLASLANWTTDSLLLPRGSI